MLIYCMYMKTMHHSQVRLLHLIYVVGPMSTMFSLLSPAHITTADVSFHSDTHLVTANDFSQKMCKHNCENEQP